MFKIFPEIEGLSLIKKIGKNKGDKEFLWICEYLEFLDQNYFDFKFDQNYFMKENTLLDLEIFVSIKRVDDCFYEFLYFFEYFFVCLKKELGYKKIFKLKRFILEEKISLLKFEKDFYQNEISKKANGEKNTTIKINEETNGITQKEQALKKRKNIDDDDDKEKNNGRMWMGFNIYMLQDERKKKKLDFSLLKEKENFLLKELEKVKKTEEKMRFNF